MAKKNNRTYTDKDITALEGLDPVRKKPGMYVGDPTSDQGIFQIIKEVVDNGIDEYLAGACTNIDIVLDLKKNLICIADNGRGIPQKSLVTVFTKLHAGSKFGDKVYSASAGTHGVGVSCTNALSTHLYSYSTRDGKTVGVKFKYGVPEGKETRCKFPKDPMIMKTQARKWDSGTIVLFHPDYKILTHKKIPYKRIFTWLALLPKLCPGLKINVIAMSGKKKVKRTYFSKKGLEGMARAKDFYVKNKKVECLCNFYPENGNGIEGYVNTIPINDGVHINAFWSALRSALTPYAKKKMPSIKSVKELIDGVIHVRVKDPLFEGQTKDKLGGVKVEKEITAALKDDFVKFFKKKSKVARSLIKRAKSIEALDKDRKAKIKALQGIEKDARKGRLPLALAVSQTKKPKEREVFLVEGESAGGGCKQARDRHYQEVLPLGGKILNTARAKMTNILKSDEIKDITLAIGGSDATQGRVGKVIFLSDSDPDGSHITALLAVCFMKLFPDWVKEGRVYTVKTPLFHMIWKGKRYFGDTADEVYKQTGGKGNVMRVKGWGEMRPDDLEYIAFSPVTRQLYQLQYSEKIYTKVMNIMGKDTAYRRELLNIEGDMPKKSKKTKKTRKEK